MDGYPPSIFRLVPDEELLAPLIEAFARACLQIPSLKVASLSTTIVVPLENWKTAGLTDHRSGASGLPLPALHFTGSFSWNLLFGMTWSDGDWSSTRNIGSRMNISAIYLEVLDGKGMERYGKGLVEKHVDYWDTIQKPQLLEDYRRVAG
ncbi:hypothetical protein QBC33DRAFT_61077 [Phialemonium atrogriseum]|uniref:Uncharacterized protein n=1 Tax=Phialemonium atrogriseum TaxID=1093897 RepID=A0AAJ0FHL8_9PEZI|nr:uncharacterized protein QBC33DRAFT_61077 [Phialemonium atrogriseum]KAK1767862.1 hypothetical protein QBC33DRAFT_61077 [Phialemonium atrogriseum]